MKSYFIFSVTLVSATRKLKERTPSFHCVVRSYSYGTSLDPTLYLHTFILAEIQMYFEDTKHGT